MAVVLHGRELNVCFMIICRLVMLSAAATAAASATTLYPTMWAPIAAVSAAVVLLAGLVYYITSLPRGTSGKLDTAAVLDLIRSRRSIYPRDFTGRPNCHFT